MAESSFRQRAGEQAAVQRRDRQDQDERAKPFTATIGNLQVALKVCVGRPTYLGADGRRTTVDSDHLVIVVAMSNARGSEPVRYEGWGRAAGIGNALASLSDDLGNKYLRVGTKSGLESWVGQVSGAERVEPGKTLTDVLVFGVPAKKAQKLTLELPRANAGGTGTLRVDVPVSRVGGFPAAPAVV